MKESNHTIDKKVQKLLALLLGIYQKGVVKEVILGYEPADDDMMILRVARKQIEMLNRVRSYLNTLDENEVLSKEEINQGMMDVLNHKIKRLKIKK
jgi:hypothetical protein